MLEGGAHTQEAESEDENEGRVRWSLFIRSRPWFPALGTTILVTTTLQKHPVRFECTNTSYELSYKYLWLHVQEDIS